MVDGCIYSAGYGFIDWRGVMVRLSDREAWNELGGKEGKG